MYFHSPPSGPDDKASRYLECQHAIEAGLQTLVGSAIASGWGEQEVLAAVIEVADNLMLANMSNSEFDHLLQSIKRRLD
ncbi:hypothetical protein ACQZ45_18905 [Agrobacterium sp. 16-2014-1-2a]